MVEADLEPALAKHQCPDRQRVSLIQRSPGSLIRRDLLQMPRCAAGPGTLTHLL